MEIKRWEKDKSPYLIFSCRKCGRWLYVKETQKTKKCLACNRAHQVKNLSHTAEIVEGMSKAISTVKIKQHELAIKENRKAPDLRGINDFRVVSMPVNDPLKFTSSVKDTILEEFEKDYSPLFRKLLEELSSKYTRFPGYMIKMMAEEFGIPGEKVKMLMSKFQKEGILIQLKNNYYAYKSV